MTAQDIKNIADDDFWDFEDFMFDDEENDEYDEYQKTLANEDFKNGELIVAKDCKYSLDDIKTRLNNNILIVGGSGTGKTRHVVTPNIHEAVGSYFICDPKGSLYKKYSGYLKKKGYEIKLIDFTHPENSDGYNPMNYLNTSQDITKLASAIVYGSENSGYGKDPYWDDISAILLEALIGYIKETRTLAPNFSTVLQLVRDGERNDDCNKDSFLKRRFTLLKKKKPDSWACEKFENVDAAPYKTYDTIRSTLSAKFSQLDTEELREMMSKESIDFARASEKKTAVFITVSDTDRSMDMLVNIFFTQAMNELCSHADKKPDGRLSIPVRFILDDFATNCRIDEFPRMISSIRSRGLSVMLMIQAEAQLSQGYGCDAQTIISNCDTYVYLGGNDVQTADMVSYRCDRPMQEVLYMPVGKCWVFRRGSEPVYTSLTDAEEYIRDMEM